MKKESLQTVSAETLAESLGISRRQVERLAKQGHVFRAGRGQYVLETSVRGFLAYTLSGQSTAYEGADTAEAKRQVLLEQARKLRNANALAENKVISREFAMQQVSASFQILIGSLEALPGRCAGEVACMNDTTVIRRFLQAEVDRCRTTGANALSAFEVEERPEHCPICHAKPWNFQCGEPNE